MSVPNQTRSVLNLIFSPFREKKIDRSSFILNDDEKSSITNSVIQLALWLLALPAITLLLLLLM